MRAKLWRIEAVISVVNEKGANRSYKLSDLRLFIGAY